MFVFLLVSCYQCPTRTHSRHVSSTPTYMSNLFSYGDKHWNALGHLRRKFGRVKVYNFSDVTSVLHDAMCT